MKYFALLLICFEAQKTHGLLSNTSELFTTKNTGQ